MNRPFEKLLGTTPELLILEELIALSDCEFSINDIYALTRIPSRKIYKVFKKFLKWGIITPCEEMTKLYAIVSFNLNLESPYAKAIIAFNNALIEDTIGEEGLCEIHDYLEEQNRWLYEIENL